MLRENKQVMQIIFKQTKHLDYDKVVDKFYEVGFLRDHGKRTIYKKSIETAFRNSQYVVSAWDGDELVGFARVVTDRSLFATIWNMIITPKYQKHGIGKMLLQKCLDKYPDCHFFLIADKENIDFYRKNGFAVHDTGMYLADGPKRCIIYR